MQICTNMSWLRHCQGPGTFNAIWVGGGVDIYNVMLYVNAATLRGLTFFYFVSYIMQFQKIIVYKIPHLGMGVYSQLKVYMRMSQLVHRAS